MSKAPLILTAIGGLTVLVLFCFGIHHVETRSHEAHEQRWQAKVDAITASGWKVIDLKGSMIVTDPHTHASFLVTFSPWDGSPSLQPIPTPTTESVNPK